MFPKYSELHIPLLAELVQRGGQSAPSAKNENGKTIYEALADYFNLSQEARNEKIDDAGIARSKWKNIVRWARNDLRKLGYLTSPRHGIWAITSNGQDYLKGAEVELVGKGGRSTAQTISLQTFRTLQKEAVRIGELGEQYVLKYEIEHLREIDKPGLASKVKQVSTEDVSAGYDVLSYDNNGSEKYIEVKTSKAKYANFEWTANELAMAKYYSSAYWIYRVYEIESESPTLLKLCNPAKLVDEGKLLLIPKAYNVTLGEGLKGN